MAFRRIRVLEYEWPSAHQMETHMSQCIGPIYISKDGSVIRSAWLEPSTGMGSELVSTYRMDPADVIRFFESQIEAVRRGMDVDEKGKNGTTAEDKG